MAQTEEDRLIDELLKNYKGPQDVIGENGLLKRLTKKVVESALRGELTHHLGYSKHQAEGQGNGNTRNGISTKTLKGDFGELVSRFPAHHAAGGLDPDFTWAIDQDVRNVRAGEPGRERGQIGAEIDVGAHRGAQRTTVPKSRSRATNT